MKERPQAIWREMIPEPPATLSVVHWQWLCDADSLTKRLQHLLADRIQFCLVSEGIAELAQDECEILGFALPHPECWVRHIEWRFCGELWITARTVLPLQSSNPLLRTIGGVPIGKYLFQPGTYQRGPIEIAELQPRDDFCRFLKIPLSLLPATLWGRRSLFCLANEKLLVSEVFFPAFFQYTFAHESCYE